MVFKLGLDDSSHDNASGYGQFIRGGATPPAAAQSIEDGDPGTPVRGYQPPSFAGVSTETVDNENAVRSSVPKSEIVNLGLAKAEQYDLESGRGPNNTGAVRNPLHADTVASAIDDEDSASELGREAERKGSMVPTEDFLEEAVIAIVAMASTQAHVSHINHNKKNCQQKISHYGTMVFFQFFYMAAAVQPALNSGAAARGFLGKDCLASNPVCFFEMDVGSLFVALVVICAWYANYRTMLEYLPATLEKMWNMFVKREFTYLRAFAFLLGLAGGIVALELNMEAMVAFISSGVPGFIFSIFVIASGVGSTFSSRFMGSDIMLSIIYERLLSCLCVDEIYHRFGNKERAAFYKNRRQLLLALSDIYTYEYLIPEKILEDFGNKISGYKSVLFLSNTSDIPVSIDQYKIVLREESNDLVAYWRVGNESRSASFSKDDVKHIIQLLPQHGSASEDAKLIQEVTSKYSIVRQQYNDAFSLLYNADSDRNWLGLLPAIKPSYLGKVSYSVCLGVLAFVCLASYPLSYNITKAAFPFLPGWDDISYLGASPNTFFYVYSLLFVVDQLARSFTLSQSFSGKAAIARWLGFGIALFVAVFSSLNLVYTASSQADKGDYNGLAAFFKIALDVLRCFFMADAGLISGLCNLLPILRIDEKYANEKRYKLSQEILADINKFICSENVECQQQAATLVLQQHEEYKPPFFPAFFTCQAEKKGVNAPLIRHAV